jgi:hypothetical protein
MCKWIQVWVSLYNNIILHRESLWALFDFKEFFIFPLIFIEFESSRVLLWCIEVDIFHRQILFWCIFHGTIIIYLRIENLDVVSKKITSSHAALLINIFVKNHVSCENLERKYECRFYDLNKHKKNKTLL